MKVYKFGAEWCKGCVQMQPTFKELSELYKGSDIDFKDIDVETDNGVELSAQYQVRNIPTILVIKNDRVIERITGTKSLNELKEVVERWK